MSYSLRFAPELEEDLYSGFVWYEDKAKGLGDEFISCAENLALQGGDGQR